MSLFSACGHLLECGAFEAAKLRLSFKTQVGLVRCLGAAFKDPFEEFV